MQDQILPETFPIIQDDDHAKFMGWLKDGRQFFLTTPFVPEINDNLGCEFVALFYFDNAGQLLEAKIDSLGPRVTMDHEKRKESFQMRLNEIMDGDFTDIEIAPFEIEQFGTRFGFIPSPLDDGSWTIEFHPGNFMAFFAPWDGEYYT
jgi:hypothetical protein